jgi:hypothetical protein
MKITIQIEKISIIKKLKIINNIRKRKELVQIFLYLIILGYDYKSKNIKTNNQKYKTLRKHRI